MNDYPVTVQNVIIMRALVCLLLDVTAVKFADVNIKLLERYSTSDNWYLHAMSLQNGKIVANRWWKYPQHLCWMSTTCETRTGHCVKNRLLNQHSHWSKLLKEMASEFRQTHNFFCTNSSSRILNVLTANIQLGNRLGVT